jgi:hypothetical protein
MTIKHEPIYNRELADKLVVIFRREIADFRLAEKTDTRDEKSKYWFSFYINKL